LITDHPPDQVRYEAARPVALGEQELGLPTQLIRTPAGVWAVYAIGEQALVVHPEGAMQGPPEEVSRRLASIVVDAGRNRADRRAAATMMELVGAAEDPGVAGVPQPYGERTDVPRAPSASGAAPPASYPISGPYNRPGDPPPSDPGQTPPPRTAP
jgi:hypothetical protein